MSLAYAEIKKKKNNYTSDDALKVAGKVWLGRCLLLDDRVTPTRLRCLLCTSCSTWVHIITLRSPKPGPKNCSFVTGGLYANISRSTCQCKQCNLENNNKAAIFTSYHRCCSQGSLYPII